MGCPLVVSQSFTPTLFYRKRLEKSEVIFWESELKCTLLRLMSRGREHPLQALCILLQPAL